MIYWEEEALNDREKFLSFFMSLTLLQPKRRTK